MKQSLLVALREFGGQIEQTLLTALKVGVGDETGSFGFFRVGNGMMDKCLLAVLPVGDRRMEEALPTTLRVHVCGGGIGKLSCQSLEYMEVAEGRSWFSYQLLQ